MPYPGVIIVTGASGNLGSAVCTLLSGRGNKVVAVYRDLTRAHATRDRFALEVSATDLADPAAAVSVVAAAVKALGRIDGLVHTVGGFAMGNAATGGLDLFERMWRINLLTTANMIQAVWPAMQGDGGSIVAIGAQPALHAGAGVAAYAGAKAAVLRLIEATADEGRPYRIRANTVLPSIIDTAQNREAMPNADYGKWVTATEVGEAIAFLLSEAAKGVSGAHLPVTSGS